MNNPKHILCAATNRKYSCYLLYTYVYFTRACFFLFVLIILF